MVRTWLTWARGMRPQTLPMSIASVLIGIGSARYVMICQGNRGTGGPGEPRFLMVSALCVSVAVALQIAANFVNDYADGVRGVDAHRDRRLHDGGRVEAPARLVASGVGPRSVLVAGAVAAAVGVTAGLAVVVLTGCWPLVLVGACCLLAVWCYTAGRHPYGYAGWGEVVAFVVFGPVAVWGTVYALAADGLVALVAAGGPALVPFGVVAVAAVVAGLDAVLLMLVNNIRDAASDAAAGKRTLVVRIGPARAEGLFLAAAVLSAALTCCVTSALWFGRSGAVAPAAAWGVLPPALAVGVVHSVRRGRFRSALPLCSVYASVVAVVWLMGLSAV